MRKYMGVLIIKKFLQIFFFDGDDENEKKRKEKEEKERKEKEEREEKEKIEKEEKEKEKTEQILKEIEKNAISLKKEIKKMNYQKVPMKEIYIIISDRI